MANRARHRNVFKFLPVGDAAKEQSAAAHISTPDKTWWKRESLAEARKQRFSIFLCADAAEQNELAISPGQFLQRCRRCLQRLHIARLTRLDRHVAEIAQFTQRDRMFHRQQAAVARDHIAAEEAAWWSAEGPGVSKFSAKVQPAQEREDFSNGDLLAALQPARQVKSCLRIEKQASPLAAGISR